MGGSGCGGGGGAERENGPRYSPFQLVVVVVVSDTLGALDELWMTAEEEK
jgi:hypothetical protein